MTGPDATHDTKQGDQRLNGQRSNDNGVERRGAHRCPAKAGRARKTAPPPSKWKRSPRSRWR